MKIVRAVSMAVVGLGVFALAGRASAQEVVMSGLDNPRGLAFAPNGDLYVAGSGSRR